MIIQAIRSFVFYALFIIITFILAVVLGTMALFRPTWSETGNNIRRFWASSIKFCLRWIVGIKSEIEGLENIPEGGCIIASKHQSDWDIFALIPVSHRPAFITKKELIDMPFWGRAATALDAITIDRKKGKQAVPLMQEEAKKAVARSCHIVIFPEGTRAQAIVPGKYKFGSALLYAALDVPIVPVALNSGICWPRNGLILWPGIAKARILPAIPPGLEAKDAQKRMIEAIETNSDELNLEAARRGIARPLTPEMRKRLAELKNAKN